MSTRYYTRAMVGERCTVCGYRLPLQLTELGVTVHPMCEWEQGGAR